jgi:hypothetical protein
VQGEEKSIWEPFEVDYMLCNTRTLEDFLYSPDPQWHSSPDFSTLHSGFKRVISCDSRDFSVSFTFTFQSQGSYISTLNALAKAVVCPNFELPSLLYFPPQLTTPTPTTVSSHTSHPAFAQTHRWPENEISVAVLLLCCILRSSCVPRRRWCIS